MMKNHPRTPSAWMISLAASSLQSCSQGGLIQMNATGKLLGSADEHLRTFAFSIGKRYQDLIPNADLVSPNKTPTIHGYEVWAYGAGTSEKDIFLVYFEKGCPRSQIRALRPLSTYRAQWFDPRAGTWLDAGNGWVQSNANAVVSQLPEFPSDNDWGLRLIYAGPAPYSIR